MQSKGKFFAGVRRLWRKLADDETGSPAVEFALVFPIFIGIVLATLQAASLFLVKAFFETAAEEAARVVLTNQTQSLTVAQFQTEVCNQLTALFTCSQVTVELEPLPAGTTNLSSMLPTFDSKGNLVGTPAVDVGANAGSSGTDMLLVVMYPWPVYGGPLGLNFANLGNGKMLMASTQVFPFGEGESRVLGHRVGGRAQHGEHAGRGHRGEESAVAAVEPGRQQQPGGPDVGHHVDLPGAGPGRFARVRPAVRRDAGVGAVQVDGAELIDGPADQPLDPGLAGRVAGHRDAADLPGHRGRRVFVDVGDDDPCPGPAEAARHRGSDAAAATCDDYARVLQFESHS